MMCSFCDSVVLRGSEREIEGSIACDECFRDWQDQKVLALEADRSNRRPPRAQAKPDRRR